MFKSGGKLSDRGQIHSLTGLRFWAALCIFILHATNHGLLPAEIAQNFDFSKAVSFFFVLSGFVLTFAYSDRTVQTLEFYRNRFARVWPVTAFSTLFVLIFLPRFIYLPSVSSNWSLSTTLIIHLFLFQAFFPFPAIFFGINAVTWSISVEAFFYAVFPWFHRKKLRNCILLFLSSCISILAISFALEGVGIADFSQSAQDRMVWQGFVYINPLMRIPEFLLGIIFARLFSGRACNEMPKAHSVQDIFPLSMYRYFEIPIFCFFLFLGFRPPFSFSPGPVALAFSQIFAGLCFALAIFICSSSHGFLSRFLGNKLFKFLGEISFGFYLFHQPIMIKAAQLQGISIAGFPILANNIFSVFAVCLLFSAVSFRFVERPLQGLLRASMSSKRHN